MPDEVMDLADQAEAQEELLRGFALAEARADARRPLPTSPVCLNCGDPTTNGARWCDADCRDTYLRRVAQHPRDE
jgi:hypothetical protein